MISPTPSPLDPSIAGTLTGGPETNLRPTDDAASAPPVTNTPPDDGRVAPVQSSSLLSAAKDMVTGALKAFGREFRDTLKTLGFDPETIGEMAKALIDPIREALQSGADFTASLFFAAAAEQTTRSQGGISGQSSLVFSSLQISVNHSTGTVQVNTEKVAVETRYEASFGAAQPQLFDIADSGAPPAVDLFGAFRDFLDRVLDGGDTSPILADSPDAAGTGPAPSAGGPDSAVRASVMRARITVVAFEQYLNGRGEPISDLTLDAAVPLMLADNDPGAAEEDAGSAPPPISVSTTA